MAVKQCKECGGKVSSSVSKCPHCGYSTRNAGCGAKLIVAAMVVALVAAFITYMGDDDSPPPASTARVSSAEVVRTELRPMRMANGAESKSIVVTWRNTGETPIRAVHADMRVFNSDGELTGLGVGAKDYAIYAVSEANPGVAPGNTHSEENGFVLPIGTNATTAEATITRVTEEAGY